MFITAISRTPSLGWAIDKKGEIKMFCKHNYDILDKTILESAFEQAKAGSQVAKRVSADCVSEYFRKKVVLILKCSKCNRIKEIIKSNP